MDTSIYYQLVELLPDLQRLSWRFESLKLEASGMMDLNVVVLDRDRYDCRIALCHRSLRSPSPRVEVHVNFIDRSAKCVAYQDAYTGIRNHEMADKEIDSFLSEWLSNIKESGYRLEQELELDR